jgi:hypothetical protein
MFSKQHCFFRRRKWSTYFSLASPLNQREGTMAEPVKFTATLRMSPPGNSSHLKEAAYEATIADVDQTPYNFKFKVFVSDGIWLDLCSPIGGRHLQALEEVHHMATQAILSSKPFDCVFCKIPSTTFSRLSYCRPPESVIKVPVVFDDVTIPTCGNDICCAKARRLILSLAESKKTKISFICGYCGKPESEPKEMSKCGKCKAVHYCNRECQAADWPIHKKCCRDATFSTEVFRETVADEGGRVGRGFRVLGLD